MDSESALSLSLSLACLLSLFLQTFRAPFLQLLGLEPAQVQNPPGPSDRLSLSAPFAAPDAGHTARFVERKTWRQDCADVSLHCYVECYSRCKHLRDARDADWQGSEGTRLQRRGKNRFQNTKHAVSCGARPSYLVASSGRDTIFFIARSLRGCSSGKVI